MLLLNLIKSGVCWSELEQNLRGEPF